MFTAIVALALAAPAEAPKEKEKPLPEVAQKEVKKLEGKWKIEKAITNDEEQAALKDKVIEFKGRNLILDGKEVLEIAAVDPSTDPKCIDLKTLMDDPGFGKGTILEGIYKLDGDDFTIAIYFGAGGKRPDKFESTKDSSVVVVTLKREKN